MTPREVQLSQQLEECREELAVARRENELLRQKLDALARRIFGVSSEALDPAQLQLLLQLPALLARPVENPPVAVVLEKRQPLRKARAPRLPEHLPVVEVVIDPAPVKAQPQNWRCIGQEVSESGIAQHWTIWRERKIAGGARQGRKGPAIARLASRASPVPGASAIPGASPFGASVAIRPATEGDINPIS